MAAEQQLILQDKTIPDSMAVQIVKSMALQQGRLVKRVRTGTAAPSQYTGMGEPEGMADAPAERLLKEITKGVQQPQVIEITDDAPVKTIKKERTKPKTSVKKVTVKQTKLAQKKGILPATPTPGPSGIKTIPKSISDKAKKALRDLGWIEDQDSPKEAAKSYKKQKKTEVENSKRVGNLGQNHQRDDLLIMTRTRKIKRRQQRGKGLDIQKWLGKTGIEFHWPGYQYMGPGTKLKKRLARGDPGINRLDKIAKQHDIDYARAKNLQDKWKADTKMIAAINKLPGKKTLTERIVRKIMKAKKRLKL